MGLSGESFIFKEPPKMPAGNDGIKQRSKPKHKKKSHTVSGIVLPGLAETLKTRNSSSRDVVNIIYLQFPSRSCIFLANRFLVDGKQLDGF